MTDDIQKIIDSLSKTSTNYGKVKRKLADWAVEAGFQEEVADKQGDLWRELDKQGNVPASVVGSGNVLSQNMLRQSEDIAMWVDQNNIDNSLFTAGTASESMYGAMVSGASLSYPPGQVPKSYYNLEKIVLQKSQQDGISQQLKTIDISLADEYDNAWSGLHITENDKARSPMFLIREVVTRLYHYYAPDDKVRQFHNLASKDKITRRHRIEYIASLIVDPVRKQTFLDEEQTFINICDELSKAHKHEELDIEESKGSLYQANALIRLLLDSL